MGQKIVTLPSILFYLVLLVLVGCSKLTKKQEFHDKRSVMNVDSLISDTVTSDGWIFQRTFATKDTFFIVADRKTNFMLLAHHPFKVPKIIAEQKDSLFYGNSIWAFEDHFILNQNSNHIVYGLPNNRWRKFRVYYKSSSEIDGNNNAFQLAVYNSLPSSLTLLSSESLRLPTLQLTLKKPLHWSGQKVSGTWVRNATKNDEEKIEIGIRGNTSRSFLKKQFKIHSDLEGNRKKYVLNGPFADFSMIRNAFAFDLSREIGLDAPEYSFCNLVLNNFFEGIYVLISKPLPKDHGLLLKVDQKADFSIRQNDATVISYQVKPKNTYKSIAKKVIDQLYTNETDFSVMEKYLPMAEAIDYVLLHELTKNIDSYKKSFYLRFDTIQKQFSFGPIWDFNFSLGNTFLSNGDNPTGFVYANEENQPHFPSWWLNYILSDKFQREMKIRYTTLRNSHFRTTYLFEQIDKLVALVENDAHFNFQRWPIAVGHQHWAQPAPPENFQEEIARMKSFLEARLAWMDGQLLKN
jgi:hypothetical protein